MNKNTLSLTVLALSLVFSFMLVSRADAAVIESYNFEDGRVPNPGGSGSLAWHTKVPAVVLTESGGNHFLRMTASPEDTGVNGGPPFYTFEPRTRSELEIGAFDRTTTNPVTLAFSYRIQSLSGGNLIAQIFQTNNIDTGGWVAILYVDTTTGTMGIETKAVGGTYTCPDGHCDDTGGQGETLTWPMRYNQWENVSLTVYFDPSNGSIDVTVDGQYKGTIHGKTILNSTMIARTQVDLNVYGNPGVIDFDNVVLSSGSPTPTPPSSTCSNLLNSALVVPASFGASFNWFTPAKELLMSVACSGSTATANIGNGSNTQYIYKTGYVWQNGAWSSFNYSGSSMDAGGNWFIGSANHALGTLDLTQKQSVLSYICDWSGTQWRCGCHDSACTTGYWNLQQFKQ